MNLHLIKKVCLISASFVWSLSPYMALAADNGNQDDVPIPIVAPAALVVEAPAEPTYTVVSTSLRAITAYTSEVGQCDESPCITANGFNVCKNGKEDVIAANFLKFGTKVRIPELFGDRIFIVQDRMNRRFPNKVDVWMKDKSDAIHFGIKTARIEVVVENK